MFFYIFFIDDIIYMTQGYIEYGGGQFIEKRNLTI